LPEPLRDPFDAMAGDVVIVGSNASAKAFKIVNNMVVAILDILICESIVLAGLAGLPGQAVVDALEDAGVTSWVLQNHIVKYVLPDDLGPGRFSTRYMAKDVSLCNAFARPTPPPRSSPDWRPPTTAGPSRTGTATTTT
jgi:3-hydroxyisobutyrate dehydrogenase-like beta-hydroxyacid dehydrogenase